MTTALEGGEGSASSPVLSLPPGKTRYPLYRRLDRSHSRSGQVRKISPPPGFDPPDHPAHSQSLYRLTYPGYCVRTCLICHHHHRVQEGLGLIPVPCVLKMKFIPPSLPRSPYVSSSFGLYCSACLGILFESILCMCCSHFSWYCFISFTIFSAPVFSLIHWFFSLSSFVIPRRCLKNIHNLNICLLGFEDT